jgi:hypothetical protein
VSATPINSVLNPTVFGIMCLKKLLKSQKS